MTRKYLRERQARHTELGKQEAAARCTHCKKPMAKVDILGGLRFCSFDCRDAALDYIDQLKEARK